MGDLDRLKALGPRRLEVLLFHEDVFARLEFKGFDHLVVRNRLVFELADLLVADGTLIAFVDEVKVQLVLGDRAVHPHGQIDEPEADRASPDRTWHRFSLPSVVAGKTPAAR